MKKAEYNKMATQRITGLIVAVVILFVVCASLAPRLPSSPLLRDSFWAHKIGAGPRYDIVLVGDSRVYRGLDPDIIGKNFGGAKCFNYGFSSAGLDSFLLNRAAGLLSPNGQKIMIIGISANSFTEEAMGNGHLKSLLKLNRRDLWIRMHLYPHLTSFDAYRISDLYSLMKRQGYYEDYHLATGFAASDRVPMDSATALSDYAIRFAHEKYSGKGEQNFVNAVDHLVQQGIKIYIIRMPTTHAMRAIEEHWQAGRLDSLEIELRNKGCEVIDPETGPYTSYDGSHLDSRSAEKLSAMIKPAS